MTADGEFVSTLSAGELDGTVYGFYDLYRLTGVEITEQLGPSASGTLDYHERSGNRLKGFDRCARQVGAKAFEAAPPGRSSAF